METEVVPDAIAESSPATTETPTSFADAQKSWTSEQRSKWQLTGIEPDATADSSPAQVETPSAQAGDPRTPPTKEEKREKKPGESWAEVRKRMETAEARVAELEREAQSRKSQPAPNEETKPAPKAPEGKPKLSDYTSKIGTDYATFEDANEAYVDARDEYRDTVLSAKQTEKQLADSWESQKAKAREKYQDFDQVALKDMPLSDVMVAVIQTRKDGAELAYYLGNNPDALARLAERTIAKADDARAWGKAEGIAEAEFDRIAESLKEPPPSPKTITHTRAPAPGPRVSAASTTPSDPLEAAYQRGDMVTAMKLENERELQRKGIRR